MTELDLKQQFNQEMINLYKRIKKETKYTPPQLLEMINKYGGYEAAIKYIITDSNTFLFALLWEQEKLSLSIEALIGKECYNTLFTSDIIRFCAKRLEEYNYAPKKIEVPNPELDALVEDLLGGLDEPIPLKEVQTPNIDPTTVISYTPISVIDWKTLLLNDKVFSSKNKDLILRMYLMGGAKITIEDLVKEEGYSTSYPYLEVIATLAKRIKSALKVSLPKSIDGKSMPWYLLFRGWVNESKAFEWSLVSELYKAIEELIALGALDISSIQVETQKEKLVVDKAIETPCDAQETIPAPFIEELEISKSIELQPMTRSSNTPKVPQANDMDALLDALFSVDEEATDQLPTIKQEVDASVVSNKIEIYMPPTDHEKELKPADLMEKVVVNDSSEGTTNKENGCDLILDSTLRKDCLVYYGAVCDVCGFDFGYTYGVDYEDLIHIYNTNSTSIAIDPHKDLVPICSNCYTVLKKGNPSLTLEQLKQRIKL